MNIVYKNGRNFSRNFFYLASLIIRMVIHFIKKLKIFPEIYSKNCSRQKASKNLPVGVGLHRWGVQSPHIPTDVSRETFVMIYSIRYANKDIAYKNKYRSIKQRKAHIVYIFFICRFCVTEFFRYLKNKLFHIF